MLFAGWIFVLEFEITKLIVYLWEGNQIICRTVYVKVMPSTCVTAVKHVSFQALFHTYITIFVCM